MLSSQRQDGNGGRTRTLPLQVDNFFNCLNHVRKRAPTAGGQCLDANNAAMLADARC
jgi:hypothetical protein